jgi:iron complex outermembrane recepter protein
MARLLAGNSLPLQRWHWQGTADQFTSFSATQNRQLGVYAEDSITLFDNLHILVDILVGGCYDQAD